MAIRKSSVIQIGKVKNEIIKFYISWELFNNVFGYTNDLKGGIGKIDSDRNDSQGRGQVHFDW